MVFRMEVMLSRFGFSSEDAGCGVLNAMQLVHVLLGASH
jgi:hypothetical protein